MTYKMSNAMRVILMCGFMSLAAAAAYAQPATRDEPWSLTAGVSQSFEDNVQLREGSGADYGTNIRGSLSRAWAFRRGGLSFNGDAGQTFYRQSSGLDALNYGFAGAASYRLTRRATWRIGGNVASSYAQDSALLTDAGLVLPKILTRTVVGSTSWSYALGPRTEIGFGLSGQRVAFQSSDFTGGSTLSGNFTISRQIGKSQRFGLLADYQHTASNGDAGTISGLLGNWRWDLGQRFGVTASGGMRPYTLPGASGFKVAPSGGLGFSVHVRQRDSLVLTYERTLEQAFGYAQTHTSHIVGLTYAMSIGPRLSLTGSGNYGRGTYPLNPDLGLIGRTAGISMGYLLGRGLSLSGHYSFYSRTDFPNPAVTSYRAGMSLTYGTSWR